MKLPLLLTSLLLISALPLTACKLYDMNIQQGNVLDAEAVDKIHLGMTAQQVQGLLGSPLIVDMAKPHIWAYVYTLKKPYRPMTSKHLVLEFADEKLVRFEKTDGESTTIAEE